MEPIDERQLARWREQGFLVFERAIPGHLIDVLAVTARQIVADFDAERHRTVFSTADRDAGRDDYFFDSAEAVHCFLEEGAIDADGRLNRPKEQAINKIGHALHDLVPAFTRFCREPLWGRLLRDLGMQSPELWQSMVIFKQPRIGGEVRWHQDASYLHTTPPGVIGLWLAMEEAREDNGCLWMAPGAHRSPLREVYEVDWGSRRGELRSLDDTPWPASGEAVPLPVPAGSLVVFSDLMPHYSSANRSPSSRMALTLHFAEAGAAWSPSNWLQRPNLPPFRV